MKRVFRFWQIIVIDILGVMFIIVALLTGWLPGPGGIPLFLIGLGLLALNHEWAKRYIDLLKKYADRIGDLIFIEKSWIQLIYDVLSPIVIIIGALLLLWRDSFWMISLGIWLSVMGVVFGLGNRHRYRNLKQWLLHSRKPKA